MDFEAANALKAERRYLPRSSRHGGAEFADSQAASSKFWQEGGVIVHGRCTLAGENPEGPGDPAGRLTLKWLACLHQPGSGRWLRAVLPPTMYVHGTGQKAPAEGITSTGWVVSRQIGWDFPAFSAGIFV
jgi:hypothetical protein